MTGRFWNVEKMINMNGNPLLRRSFLTTAVQMVSYFMFSCFDSVEVTFPTLGMSDSENNLQRATCDLTETPVSPPAICQELLRKHSQGPGFD